MSPGLESGLSGAALPLESSPGTPGLTQAQEGGGPGCHGPALSQGVLESVLRDGSLQPAGEGDVPLGLSGAVPTPAASHKREERPPRPAHFPLRGRSAP